MQQIRTQKWKKIIFFLSRRFELTSFFCETLLTIKKMTTEGKQKDALDTGGAETTVFLN